MSAYATDNWKYVGLSYSTRWYSIQSASSLSALKAKELHHFWNSVAHLIWSIPRLSSLAMPLLACCAYADKAVTSLPQTIISAFGGHNYISMIAFVARLIHSRNYYIRTLYMGIYTWQQYFMYRITYKQYLYVAYTSGQNVIRIYHV